VGKAYYRDPIRLSTPPRLLDGQTLNYLEDWRLIEHLMNLHVAVARHNDYVEMTNQAQAMSPVPDSIHAQWFKEIQGRVAAVTAVRDDILRALSEQK
jgi:hypothetical protein